MGCKAIQALRGLASHSQNHFARRYDKKWQFPGMKLFAAFIWFYLRILPSEKAAFCGSDATQRAIDSTTRISAPQSNRLSHYLFKTIVCCSSSRGDNSTRRCKCPWQGAVYCQPKPLILYYRFLEVSDCQHFALGLGASLSFSFNESMVQHF